MKTYILVMRTLNPAIPHANYRYMNILVEIDGLLTLKTLRKEEEGVNKRLGSAYSHWEIHNVIAL